MRCPGRSWYDGCIGCVVGGAVCNTCEYVAGSGSSSGMICSDCGVGEEALNACKFFLVDLRLERWACWWPSVVACECGR